MTAHKALYVSFFVILLSSAHGANPNKDARESYEEEDLGFHVGLGGKWPWGWGSHIGARVGAGEGPNDDNIGLGFDIGNDGPTGSNGKPSIGSGAIGAIDPGIGIGPDDGCDGCMSDCPNCGSGSYQPAYNPPLDNQPMYCTPVDCPDGDDCGGFGLHLDFGWPSLFEKDRPHQAPRPSETINAHDTNQN